MKLNCKPGDLAIVIDNHKFNPNSAGAICEVLTAVYKGDVTLPNGIKSIYTRDEPGWLIKLHSRVMIKWFDGVYRLAEYACCPDSKLRPLRDNPGQDEILRIVGLPEKEPA